MVLENGGASSSDALTVTFDAMQLEPLQPLQRLQPLCPRPLCPRPASRARIRPLLASALAILAGALGCTSSSSPPSEPPGAGGTPPTAPPPVRPPIGAPPTTTEPLTPAGMDEDDVVKLYPDAPGAGFHLGSADLNADARIDLEQEGTASAGEEGSLRFWTVTAYAFEYTEGEVPGKTARVHIGSDVTSQRFDWRTQEGFLATPDDLGDQEFTAYVRVHGIFDPEHAVFELKVRGGRHTEQSPPLASCTLMTFATSAAPGVSRFGKELDHPLYDYVNLPLRFATELTEDRWFGLKLVTFTDAERPDRVINRLYVDANPFMPDGTPRNDFRLLTEYIDRAGVNTGRYDTLVNWRGVITTLRVDGVDSVDIALLSARPITPP